MREARVTIIVVPREHFSYAQTSLESIYLNTAAPVQLIYVDGGSPKSGKQYLEAQAREKGFRLIRAEHYLAPNQARNIALPEVNTEFVAFVDNDVVVAPGWLEALLHCAEETRAWAVSPIYCIGKPEDQIIHAAGGDAHIEEVQGTRRFVKKAHFCDGRVADVRSQLRRAPCEFIDFHCLLVRTEVFERLGPLDEELLTYRDNIDFGLAVHRAGGVTYFEPSAQVTQLFPPPLAWSDLPYYLLRWSREWIEAGARHFHKKWDLPLESGANEDRWLEPRRRLALQPYRNRACRVMGWRLGNWTVDWVEDLLARHPLKDWQRQLRARTSQPLHRAIHQTKSRGRAS